MSAEIDTAPDAPDCGTHAGLTASPVRLSPRVAHAARVASYGLIALFAVASALLVMRTAVRDETLGFDFRGTLWEPAQEIRDGSSPYPVPVEAELEGGNPALYPPLLMLLVVPLTFLPWWLGLTVWTAFLAGAIVGSLLILRVHDPRCHALALLSLPVLRGLEFGNATLLLIPFVALAWRWRGRWLRTGGVVGVAIAAKLFLWPLVFWLVGTRRHRAAAVSLVAALGVVLLPWALIGFAGLWSYPDLLRVAEEIYATHSFSVATIFGGLGLDATVASQVTIALGLVLAGVALVVGRSGNDRAALSLAILAALVGTPILWEYYYALLLIPLSVAWPRFSWAWMILPLFYATHSLPRPLLLETELEPGGSACCRPDDVPFASWVFNHAPPGMWPALGHAVLAALLVAAVAWSARQTMRAEASR